MTSPLPTRPIILTFAGGYLPGYKAGGPIRSLASMVDRLGDEFDFMIVTRDRDLGDTAAFPDVALDSWTPVGKARVFYRSPGEAGWRSMLSSLKGIDYDLIYLNSFFSSEACLRPLFYQRMGKLKKRPVLLAPRGEFSPGALALKPVKKRAFLKLARTMGLHAGTTFQASSEDEAADIRRVMGTTCIATAANISVACDLSGASAPGFDRFSPSALGEPLKGVFLSRISPMKNLAGALSMLAKVSCPVTYDIYGPIEDHAYWARCLELVAALPAHIAVHHRGELRPQAVESVLSAYDFFFLPTRGENYGHVIREALSVGLPVLISDQTPWRGLEQKGAGADLPLAEPEAFVTWIETFSLRTSAEKQSMRDAARRLGNDPVTAERNLQANREMFLAALSQPTAVRRPLRG